MHLRANTLTEGLSQFACAFCSLNSSTCIRKIIFFSSQELLIPYLFTRNDYS